MPLVRPSKVRKGHREVYTRPLDTDEEEELRESARALRARMRRRGDNRAVAAADSPPPPVPSPPPIRGTPLPTLAHLFPPRAIRPTPDGGPVLGALDGRNVSLPVTPVPTVDLP